MSSCSIMSIQKSSIQIWATADNHLRRYHHHTHRSRLTNFTDYYQIRYTYSGASINDKKHRFSANFQLAVLVRVWFARWRCKMFELHWFAPLSGDCRDIRCEISSFQVSTGVHSTSSSRVCSVLSGRLRNERFHGLDAVQCHLHRWWGESVQPIKNYY